MSWPISEPAFGSYKYLLREASIMLGLGANINALSHEEDGLLNSIVQRGVRRFYTPPRLPGDRQSHEWSFLMPLSTLTTSAPQSTGTVTVVSGVVTLASATWPSDAADAEIIINGVTHTIDTRDSSTQITLDDTSINAAAGTTYELVYPSIDLPSDFAYLKSELTFKPGDSTLWPPIQVVSEEMIRQRRQHADYSFRPSMAAIYPKSLDATTGTRWVITFFPIPDEAYQIDYRYRVNPGELSGSNLPYGGVDNLSAVVASVLATAEAAKGISGGPYWQDFMQQLQAAIDHDRRNNSPRTMGKSRDRSDVPMQQYGGPYNEHWFSSQTVDYTGYSP